MSSEAEIAPPQSQLVLNINAMITRNTLAMVMMGLPAYQITSLGRTPERNKAVGGVENSAHLHNLAVDFVLPGLTRAQVKEVFEVFKKRWPGYSINEGDHIHANLPRTVSRYVGMLLFGGAGAAALLVLVALTKPNKPNN